MVTPENLIVVKKCLYAKRDQFMYRFFRHPDWVMLIIEKGQCRYKIEGVTGAAGPGDLVIIPPKLEIEQVMLAPMRFHYVAFSWRDDRGQDDEAVFQQVLREAPEFKLSISETSRFSFNAEQLRQNAIMVRLDNRIVEHYVNDLWLLGRMEQRSKELSLRLQEDSLMAKAGEMIRESAFQPITLKVISSQLYLSSVQFTRRFQAVFGMSPMDYLNRIRLEKARSLLEQTEYTIEDIASMCGYESRSYFCRFFSKHMKRSPSEYRRMNKVGYV